MERTKKNMKLTFKTIFQHKTFKTTFIKSVLLKWNNMKIASFPPVLCINKAFFLKKKTQTTGNPWPSKEILRPCPYISS